MAQNPPFLYPYTVRRSPRARCVRLIVSTDGLVVVVPLRFSVSRDLPPILEARKDWIAKTLAGLMKRTQLKNATKGLPETIELRALGEKWQVERAPLTRDRMIANEGYLTLTLASDFSENEALVALKRWLHVKGRSHLSSLLDETAKRHRFAYVKVTVKEQKSRWGSCSSKGNINLNSRLIFLPLPVVRHVLLHELCHLKELNHSKAFHALLNSLDPDAEKNEAELKRAWNFVPGWAL